MKDVARYSTGSKILHWLIAVIVILMLSFSFFLDDIPDQYQSTAYLLHKSFGLTVLFFMLIRIFWIQYRGRPPLPTSVPTWEKRLSRGVQYSFYVLLILMPMSGWILSVSAKRIPSYFGLFEMPLPIEPNKALSLFMKNSHKTIAWVLIVLAVLHIAGAIKHHVFDKDNVLKRMLPGN